MKSLYLAALICAFAYASDCVEDLSKLDAQIEQVQNEANAKIAKLQAKKQEMLKECKQYKPKTALEQKIDELEAAIKEAKARLKDNHKATSK